MVGHLGETSEHADPKGLPGLRPHCERCSGAKGRETIEIGHPAGQGIQWDWFERRKAPGKRRPMCCWARCRTRPHPEVLAESMDQAHFIEAMDAVMRRLGGTALNGARTRLATVVVPGGADIQASFAPVANYYGAIVTRARPGEATAKSGRHRCEVLLRPLVGHHDAPAAPRRPR
jgi:hypothetical protein